MSFVTWALKQECYSIQQLQEKWFISLDRNKVCSGEKYFAQNKIFTLMKSFDEDLDSNTHIRVVTAHKGDGNVFKLRNYLKSLDDTMPAHTNGDST